MKRCAIILTVFLLLGPLGAAAAGLQVEAKSGILLDVATGTVLFEQNAHEALAPASVTKVMTMLLIMEAIDSGKIRWTDTVTASETAAAKGGSQVYLKAGETMSVEDMVKSIAVSSANDCACAMAEHLAGSEEAFVTLMNQRAQELGMTDTHFVNCTGLDDAPGSENHKTSAHDIALMSRQLLKNHPDIRRFTTIWMDTIRGGEFGLSNTNKMIRFYNGATGLKTGFTAKAGYCLSASAQREGLELIAVVMGAETSAKRFASCKGLLDYGFAGFALFRTELPQGETVPVKLGQAPSVSLALQGEGLLLVDKGKRNAITVETALEEALTAPVEQGQVVGTVTVKAGDETLAQYPVVAGEAVAKVTWGQMFRKVMGLLCGAGI